MPTIFRELLVEQFDGKIFSRQSAIRIIADYHLQYGGIIEDERDLVGVFKRATQVMQKQNMGLVNKGYGTWELHYKKNEWFMTNPKEIKELYYRVIKKLDERYLPYSSLIDVETVTVEEPLRLLI